VDVIWRCCTIFNWFLISKSIYNSDIQSENPIVNESNSNQNNKENTVDRNPKNLDSKGQIQAENPIVNEANVSKINSENYKNTSTSNSAKTNAIATTKNDIETSKTSKEDNTTKKTIFSTKSSVADIKSSRHRSLKTNSNTKKSSNQLLLNQYLKLYKTQ